MPSSDAALTTVAVGVDRSSAGSSALRWAIDFAGSSAQVRAVSTWQIPLIGAPPLPLEGMPGTDVLSKQCAQKLFEVVSSITSPQQIEQVVVEGNPGPTLLEATADSDLLVVGRTGYGKRHGLSRIAEVVLGSTARHCVHHATVPVVAVPEGSNWPHPATVVVGVDGSSGSIAALDWALTYLPADATIHVIRAFAPWVGDGLAPMDLVDDAALHDAFRQETQNWVDDSIERLGLGAEGKPIVEVAIGNARDVVADPGYAADLIVVGERGHTGIAGRFLGSVADHLVRYARCPVVVVPTPLP